MAESMDCPVGCHNGIIQDMGRPTDCPVCGGGGKLVEAESTPSKLSQLDARLADLVGGAMPAAVERIQQLEAQQDELRRRLGLIGSASGKTTPPAFVKLDQFAIWRAEAQDAWRQLSETEGQRNRWRELASKLANALARTLVAGGLSADERHALLEEAERAFEAAE